MNNNEKELKYNILSKIISPNKKETIRNLALLKMANTDPNSNQSPWGNIFKSYIANPTLIGSLGGAAAGAVIGNLATRKKEDESDEEHAYRKRLNMIMGGLGGLGVGALTGFYGFSDPGERLLQRNTRSTIGRTITDTLESSPLTAISPLGSAAAVGLMHSRYMKGIPLDRVPLNELVKVVPYHSISANTLQKPELVNLALADLYRQNPNTYLLARYTDANKNEILQAMPIKDIIKQTMNNPNPPTIDVFLLDNKLLTKTLDASEQKKMKSILNTKNNYNTILEYLNEVADTFNSPHKLVRLGSSDIVIVDRNTGKPIAQYTPLSASSILRAKPDLVPDIRKITNASELIQSVTGSDIDTTVRRQLLALSNAPIDSPVRYVKPIFGRNPYLRQKPNYGIKAYSLAIGLPILSGYIADRLLWSPEEYERSLWGQ